MEFFSSLAGLQELADFFLIQCATHGRFVIGADQGLDKFHESS
jgi:hypothetical protein